MLFHVISSHKNKGLHNDGNTHIIEYFYPKRALENAEGKPLAEMIRSVSDALAGEEIKDTTGLAEREEVNGSSVRELLFITRTLFIIIQIIGKTKSWKNIHFLEQMRHIQHASM